MKASILMDPAAVDAFKLDVRAYVTTCKDLQALVKQAGALRKQKSAMEEKVMRSMRTFEVDECQVSDGKVVIKSSKRCGSIKPKVVLEKITEFFGDAEVERAQQLIQILEDSRDVIEKETVRYNKKRRLAETLDEESVSVDN